jgi:hypothetical protein
MRPVCGVGELMALQKFLDDLNKNVDKITAKALIFRPRPKTDSCPSEGLPRLALEFRFE